MQWYRCVLNCALPGDIKLIPSFIHTMTCPRQTLVKKVSKQGYARKWMCALYRFATATVVGRKFEGRRV